MIAASCTLSEWNKGSYCVRNHWASLLAPPSSTPGTGASLRVAGISGTCANHHIKQLLYIHQLQGGLLTTQTTWISGAMVYGEVGWRKYNLKNHSFDEGFASGSALSICHQDRRSRFAANLSLLTPFILFPSDVLKSLSTARKRLRIFIKLSRRSTMTWPWQECRCKGIFQESDKGKLAVADHRHLYAKTLIADIAAQVENDWWENVNKHTQVHGVTTKTVHATLHKDLWVLK